ncbi:MAG: Flp pilus assembly complex ATPase component TadA, partial [Phycisphaerae bacterium]|nr:Flp pilus assembly complex ATPase component TadA [Phycisphaerae bacterium]
MAQVQPSQSSAVQQAPPAQPTVLQEMLMRTLRSGASDLHLVPGHPPMLRIHTRLVPMEGKDVLKPQETVAMAKEMLGEGPMAMLAKRRDLDFSTHVKDMGRFRVNAHFQRDMLAVAFRSIAAEVPRLQTLNLPPVVERFVDLPRGLVLVTGATGSGKSTTLASVIKEMNLRADRHVITLEDPIEYLIPSRTCLIEQR